jgi:hypothetical protein
VQEHMRNPGGCQTSAFDMQVWPAGCSFLHWCIDCCCPLVGSLGRTQPVHLTCDLCTSVASKSLLTPKMFRHLIVKYVPWPCTKVTCRASRTILDLTVYGVRRVENLAAYVATSALPLTPRLHQAVHETGGSSNNSIVGCPCDSWLENSHSPLLMVTHASPKMTLSAWHSCSICLSLSL